MKKYILAVDPFEEELYLTEEGKDWLENLLVLQQASLDVVHVLPIPKEEPPQILCAAFERQLKRFSEELNLSVPVSTHLLIEHSNSERILVRSIISHAIETGAEMILLTSYGRRRNVRILLGSFAESLLAESPVPLLFLNAPLHREAKLETVLYPTDFSAASKVAFEIFIKQFQSTQSQVILFHANPPAYPIVLLNGLPFQLPDQYVRDINQFVSDESTRWAKLAKRMNCEIQVQISEKLESIIRSIRRTAKNENIDLIALTASQAKSRHQLLGKVSSSLFSKLRYPVWICGPEAIRIQRRKNKHKKQGTDLKLSHKTESPQERLL